jgi:hypothetical protein
MIVFNLIIHSSQPSRSKNASTFKWVLLTVVAGFFIIPAIMFAVLHGMERKKTGFNQTEQVLHGMEGNKTSFNQMEKVSYGMDGYKTNFNEMEQVLYAIEENQASIDRTEQGMYY